MLFPRRRLFIWDDTCDVKPKLDEMRWKQLFYFSGALIGTVQLAQYLQGETIFIQKQSYIKQSLTRILGYSLPH